MGSSGPKGVVVKLKGIPTEIGKSAGQTATGPRHARHDHSGRVKSWHHAQGRVPVVGNNGPRRNVVRRGVPVVTQPRGIEQRRGENVAPFQGADVAQDLAQDRRGIEAIWRSEGGVVIVIGREQAILIAEPVIQPRGDEIFLYHSYRCEDEGGYVRVFWIDRPVGVR